MGQLPLDPPNVGGWDGGKNWINTTTLLARYNFSLFLLGGRPQGANRRGRPGGQRFRPGRRVETTTDVMALVRPDDLKTPSRLVDRLTDCLLSTPLTPAQRTELLEEAQKPMPEDTARVQHLVQLIMSTPNYQVC
jgi:hypothetical protein